MKEETKPEKKISEERNAHDKQSGRENIEPLEKKETMEERAKREGWTDTVESHLGIDE
ncbi:MAG TPA: hypothetical protein VI385_11415 [Flavisolibacter sp.]